MINLPTMTVPTGFKVPSVLPQNGQSAGSFIDHLGSNSTSSFTSAKNFASTTALSSSLSRKLTTVRNDVSNKRQTA